MSNYTLQRGYQLFLLVITTLFITIFFSHCKKTEPIIEERPITACFTVSITDHPFGTTLFSGTTTFTDADFHFNNCSTADNGITFLWNFGDGDTSTSQYTRHKYAKRGTYTVSLVVYRNNKAYDTATQNVTVILGQQSLWANEYANTVPIDICQRSNGEFDILGYSTGDLRIGQFFLMRIDSAMKQKSLKYFPRGYTFSSIRMANDSNYILTGSTIATSNGGPIVPDPNPPASSTPILSNEIVKISPEGNLLWSKVLSANDWYSDVRQAPEGLVVTGVRPVTGDRGNIFQKSIVVKTDANGNIEWEKPFVQQDISMDKTWDAVVDNEGIVVAGTRLGDPSKCGDCDSLFITRLDYSGNILWKNSLLWGYNENPWSYTRTTKLSTGGFAVFNQNTEYLLILSPKGNLLSRTLLKYNLDALEAAGDGNVVVLAADNGNGSRIAIRKLTSIGVPLWDKYVEGRFASILGGYACCSFSEPVAVHSLPKGGHIILGYRDDPSPYSNAPKRIVVLQLDEEGRLM